MLNNKKNLKPPPYYVYLIGCIDGSIYTGITTDLKRRFREHEAGEGGHYTRAHKVEKILFSEKHPTRSAASRRESEIKSWTRLKKLAWLRNNG